MRRETCKQGLCTAVCGSLCWTVCCSLCWTVGPDSPLEGSQSTKKDDTNCVTGENCCTTLGVQKIPLLLTIGSSLIESSCAKVGKPTRECDEGRWDGSGSTGIFGLGQP